VVGERTEGEKERRPPVGENDRRGELVGGGESARCVSGDS